VNTAPHASAPLRKHLHEWPFWCLLATRAAGGAEEELPAILTELNDHAARISQSVRFESGKGILWAAACRVYILARVHGKDAGKIGYVHMIFGIGRAFRSPRFARIAFDKIKKRVLSPFSVMRSFRESVADAFLEHSWSPAVPHFFETPETIMNRLNDAALVETAVRAVTPPGKLWDAIVAEYYQRRAGYLRTMFSSAKRWRADMLETAAGKRAV
jgi:hypothetical protein